jgi:hypothetical protein
MARAVNTESVGCPMAVVEEWAYYRKMKGKARGSQ